MIFIIEILVQFNLGFYEKGIVIVNRKRIYNHYLKKKFIFDIITTIS